MKRILTLCFTALLTLTSLAADIDGSLKQDNDVALGREYDFDDEEEY